MLRSRQETSFSNNSVKFKCDYLPFFSRPVLEHLEIRPRFSVKSYSQKVHQENTYMASTRLGVNELCQVEGNRVANPLFMCSI